MRSGQQQAVTGCISIFKQFAVELQDILGQRAAALAKLVLWIGYLQWQIRTFKNQQTAHAGVTLTDMYNVLEKLRNGETLTANDKTLHKHGLVGLLKTLHEELDAFVLAAYGWSVISVTDTDALLSRLVALNAQRAAEEAKGNVCWLRPAFQAQDQVQAQQDAIAMPEQAVPAIILKRKGKVLKSTAAQPWPSSMAEQVKAVADVLTHTGTALDVDTIAANFRSRGRWRERLPSILDTLAALGRIHAQSPTLWVNAR